jgi:putative transposase
VLDDFSRFIVAWTLCATMKALDNGSSYVATDLAKWLDQQNMEHLRSAPYHPQTQGKIERWHQTLKNRILLEHYYLPGDRERQVAAFVEHYNHDRDHESLESHSG